ncbi:hypothetical protein B0H17DRAFT_1046059 [Mycena rosella]|uniref:Uncharacterized protein n=1 Tax=Mycena rosella TaxID=1033263 RepID=A0AAD7GLV1_MYCRO|nr:hypothetical protein B0H17DRAFT_1046059 [Mycena rosella]
MACAGIDRSWFRLQARWCALRMSAGTIARARRRRCPPNLSRPTSTRIMIPTSSKQILQLRHDRVPHGAGRQPAPVTVAPLEYVSGQSCTPFADEPDRLMITCRSCAINAGGSRTSTSARARWSWIVDPICPFSVSPLRNQMTRPLSPAPSSTRTTRTCLSAAGCAATASIAAQPSPARRRGPTARPAKPAGYLGDARSCLRERCYAVAADGSRIARARWKCVGGASRSSYINNPTPTRILTATMTPSRWTMATPRRGLPCTVMHSTPASTRTLTLRSTPHASSAGRPAAATTPRGRHARLAPLHSLSGQLLTCTTSAGSMSACTVGRTDVHRGRPPKQRPSAQGPSLQPTASPQPNAPQEPEPDTKLTVSHSLSSLQNSSAQPRSKVETEDQPKMKTEHLKI